MEPQQGSITDVMTACTHGHIQWALMFFCEMKQIVYSCNRYLNCSGNYRVSQEERSVFWEVIVSIILCNKFYLYLCPILNGFWDKAVSPYSTLYTVQTSNTPCPHMICKLHWCWWWNFWKCIIPRKLYQLCHLNNKYWY
jgi:hypothetical protein